MAVEKGNRIDAIGINKGIDSASVALFNSKDQQLEIHLRERWTRKKRDGDLYLQTILKLVDDGPINQRVRESALVAETGYYDDPVRLEQRIKKPISFEKYLIELGLEPFSRLTNPKLQYVTHHRSHARAATWISPFKKALVVVVDGLGSNQRDFDRSHPEFPLIERTSEDHWVESMSAYLVDGIQLECVAKEFQHYDKDRGHFKNVSIGTLYECAAEMIFGNSNEAGKVMGLASFGRSRRTRPQGIFGRDALHAEIRGQLPYRGYGYRTGGKDKERWDKSRNLDFYKDLAATVQEQFEADLMGLIQNLRNRFPSYQKLILTGGCALNCVFLAKLSRTRMFSQIYTPPFPGDEGVAFGAILESLCRQSSRFASSWRPTRPSSQVAYFGPRRRNATLTELKRKFPDATIVGRAGSLNRIVELLQKGEVLALFDGRSESGPRALGHRSVLASPLFKGVTDRLNSEVKHRERFRPYGVVVPRQWSHLYFELSRNQPSPFMDFAPIVRKKWQPRLREVVHRDGTCRIQTLQKSQNKWLFELLLAFHRKTGVACLINTSLNVMDEPIVETLEDLARFWQSSVGQVNHAIVDGYFLSRHL